MASSLEPIVVLSLVVGVIAAVIFAGVLVALIVFTVRYRDVRAGSAPQIHGHRALEIAWTAAPLLLLAIIFVLSLVTLGQIGQGATFGSLEPPLHVDVIGHQWWFEFRYAGGAVTANELHVPVGVPIELDLSSADVIHDLWVPELGAKSDVVPGQRNVMRLFTARAGTFSGECAEFCGLEHARMAMYVYVQKPADFQRWLRAEAAPARAPSSAAARAGRDAFFANQCASCHTIRGTPARGVVGPDLTHVGSRSSIAALTLPNTRAALTDWLRDPQHAKPGNRMPDLDLSRAELRSLVAYLEGLR